MSIFFRLKYATGMIPSADRLDANWEKLIKMRDDLRRMEESNELKQYEDLKNLIDSSAFQHDKREIESLKYAGSEEEQKVLAYKALVNSYAIRNYLKVSNSSQLSRFEKIVAGPDLKEYLHLEKEVGCDDFKIRMSAYKKKEFVNTPDYTIFKEYNRLKKSDDIRFWQKFIHSESYQNYLNTIGSPELKNKEELCGLISTNEFKNRIIYLKDKKRFLKSVEYKKICAFNDLAKSRFMNEYLKLKSAKELDFFEKWDIIFEENFSGKELNSKHWQSENWLNFRHSGTSFSQEGDMQSFNGLKNILVNNNTLSMLARKEKASGMVWIPSIGLSPKHFEYTSSIVNSADFFRLHEGVVEAKVRFKKDKSITSAFSLTGEKPFPQIDLMRSTNDGVGIGIIDAKGHSTDKYLQISGLNDGKYHIYRLELLNNQLVWKINGYEVYRCDASLKEPLFLNLLTTLHGKVNEHLLPHRFEVDWIRCFAVKL